MSRKARPVNFAVTDEMKNKTLSEKEIRPLIDDNIDFEFPEYDPFKPLIEFVESGKFNELVDKAKDGMPTFSALAEKALKPAIEMLNTGAFQNQISQVVLTQSIVVKQNFAGAHQVDWFETGKLFRVNLEKFWEGYGYTEPQLELELNP